MQNIRINFLLIIFLFLINQNASAFHKDIYQPRVPEEILFEIKKMKNPFSPSPERIAKGKQIYFIKGLCVSCHSKDGQGAVFPGHPPRDFTDKKWQRLRSDGELMWVLKNGSADTGMPVSVGQLITEEEGWNVILFIRTFKGK